MAPWGPSADEPQRAGEARYQALFDTMGPAVLLMQGPACVDCNPAALALFGLDRREEMIGKTPLDFAPELQPGGERSAELVERHAREAMILGSTTFEWTSRRKDGTPFLMEVRFARCGPPETGLFLCIAVDISARRQTEEALRASEARYRAIVEYAAEAILVVDRTTQAIAYANPAASALLGRPARLLESLTLPDLLTSDASSGGAAPLREPEAGPREQTLSMVHADGREVECGARVAPVGLNGRACSLLMLTDLTERRQADAARLRTQKLEALGTLAGGLAHDFNNLLHATLGYVAAGRAEPETARAQQLFDRAEEALGRATRLTNQLLTFSRGGAPVRSDVVLAPVLERAARYALAGTGARCRPSLDDGLWPVDADGSQLEQVVQNLVLNAAQAMSGGGEVGVSARNVVAPGPGVPMLPAGRYVAFAVSDTGAGISAANLPRIFDPYFSTRQHGAGLGLATAHSIVSSHRGAIEVASTEGVGTTMTVYWPAGKVAAASPPEPSAIAGALRVLVMDDEPMIREVTSLLLASLRHEAETSPDGAAAVAAYVSARAAGRPFDLVILDLTVPAGVGGLAALRELRAVDPDVRAILASGYSDDAAMANYAAHGFSGVLRKPYSRRQLAQVLDEQRRR